jgi:hypothetical protein
MAGPIAFLSPDPTQSTQFIPGGNTPASGAQLFVYAPGTTQKISTFTDPSASTARTNPIVLDSGGNIPGNGEVWITSTAKFVLAPSNDADPPQSPYWTRDNYYGINNITAAQVQSLSAQSEWVQGSTATFVGVTAFSVVGDQTLIYTLGRRVKATVTGGDRFGIVTSAVLATNTTAVGVTLDSSTLNGGLSSVSYGILSTPNGSIPWTIETSTGLLISASVSSNVFSASSFVGNSLIVSSATVSSVVASTVTASVVKAGSGASTTGPINIPYGSFLYSKGTFAGVDVGIIGNITVNGLTDVLSIGSVRGTNISGRLGIGPPSTSDVPPSTFALWRDTAASTTRFYYNNSGTMTSSAAFLP